MTVSGRAHETFYHYNRHSRWYDCKGKNMSGQIKIQTRQEKLASNLYFRHHAMKFHYMCIHKQYEPQEQYTKQGRECSLLPQSQISSYKCLQERHASQCKHLTCACCCTGQGSTRDPVPLNSGDQVLILFSMTVDFTV